MRTVILSIVLLLSACAFSQNCARVTSSYITNPSGDNFNYSILVNWNSDGQKHIFVNLFCGSLTLANLIKTECIDISCSANCSGSTSYSFQCAGSVPTATFVPYTGNCNGGTQCGPTQQYPPGGGTPLPIKISSFSAYRNASIVSLEWETKSEENAKEFIIERKTENSFIKIGSVSATNDPSGSSYSFTDNDPGSTTIQYRLKMVDKDGSFIYSPTRIVKDISTGSMIELFPNPSSGTVNISINAGLLPAEAQLIDSKGQLQKKIDMHDGNLKLSDLKTGLYQVRIIQKATGAIISRKLIVIN